MRPISQAKKSRDESGFILPQREYIFLPRKQKLQIIDCKEVFLARNGYLDRAAFHAQDHSPAPAGAGRHAWDCTTPHG
jgi:hypothetical protein